MALARWWNRSRRKSRPAPRRRRRRRWRSRRCRHPRRQRPRGGRSRPRRAAAARPARRLPPPSRPRRSRSPSATRNGSRSFAGWSASRRSPGRRGLPDLVVQRLIEQLDEIIASETLRAGLLPRAPHVVPQLMKTLRDEGYSSADVASRISRDVVLTAEVVRSATSVLQRGDDARRSTSRAPSR